MAFLEPSDLEPFAVIDPVKAAAMIEDAEATAVMVAPCLAHEDDLSPSQIAAVKAVLRGAVLRWHEIGSGVVSQETLGSFNQSYDTRSRRAMFWPSEIDQLQSLCADGGNSGAFDVDGAAGRGRPRHDDICAANFGAEYCSCGALLTGAWPLWWSQ